MLPLLDYGERSKQPLTILLFLLPAVLFYEIRLLLALRGGGEVLVNKAQHGIFMVFSELGVGALGLALPGIVLVLILLVWHLLLRARWRVDPPTLLWMAAESAAMALPLLLLGRLLTPLALAEAAPIGGAADPWRDLGLGERVAVSLGAGIYEELLFRMLLLGVLHTLLVDLLKVPARTGTLLSIAVAALLFTLYHPLRETGGVAWRQAAFFFVAGLWLGGLMVWRGFGITVGAHALYDLVVLVGADRSD